MVFLNAESRLRLVRRVVVSEVSMRPRAVWVFEAYVSTRGAHRGPKGTVGQRPREIGPAIVKGAALLLVPARYRRRIGVRRFHSRVQVCDDSVDRDRGARVGR